MNQFAMQLDEKVFFLIEFTEAENEEKTKNELFQAKGFTKKISKLNRTLIQSFLSHFALEGTRIKLKTLLYSQSTPS